jgi:DNA-binding GntR family transcriptional regulator
MSVKETIYETPPHQSLADAVAQSIREAIVMGKVKPGQKIVEYEVAKKMMISRSPVREALRMLEKDGLVTINPRRGTEVKDISICDVKEIYAIRANLENLATKLAVPNLNDGALKTMQSLVKEMAAKAKANDVAGTFELNEKFHDIIIKASNNQRLCELIHSLRTQIRRFRMASLSREGDLSVAYKKHLRVLDACLKKDPHLAGGLIQHQITEAGEKLIVELEKGRKKGKTEQGHALRSKSQS